LSRHLGSQLAAETQQKAEEEEQWEAVERGVGSMTVTGDQENHRDSVATGTDFMKL
jgi:hypothetical protein